MEQGLRCNLEFQDIIFLGFLRSYYPCFAGIHAIFYPAKCCGIFCKLIGRNERFLLVEFAHYLLLFHFRGPFKSLCDGLSGETFSIYVLNNIVDVGKVFCNKHGI